MTTIVIADDHPVFRRGLRDVIEDDGAFEVVAEASDGIEAIALIKQHRPAIAVLDVAMPRADGLEVLAQARSWPTAPAFVLLTMYETYAERALQLGALGYLTKEEATAELIACLRSVVRGRRYVSRGIQVAEVGGVLRVDTPLAVLTESERRVLRLLVQLKTSREIAEILCVSHRTVQNHRQNMCEKLGLRGPKALLRFALEHKADLMRGS
jgi:DNA-binding NarL/FixJ family response regulator